MKTQAINGSQLPGDEEDLALAAVVDGDEVEIEDGVAAVVVRQGGRHLVVALPGGADLVHRQPLRAFVDLKHDVPRHFLPLHLHERVLALIRHSHPHRRLQNHIIAPFSNQLINQLIHNLERERERELFTILKAIAIVVGEIWGFPLSFSVR